MSRFCRFVVCGRRREHYIYNSNLSPTHKQLKRRTKPPSQRTMDLNFFTIQTENHNSPTKVITVVAATTSAGYHTLWPPTLQLSPSLPTHACSSPHRCHPGILGGHTGQQACLPKSQTPPPLPIRTIHQPQHQQKPQCFLLRNFAAVAPLSYQHLWFYRWKRIK